MYLTVQTAAHRSSAKSFLSPEIGSEAGLFCRIFFLPGIGLEAGLFSVSFFLEKLVLRRARSLLPFLFLVLRRVCSGERAQEPWKRWPNADSPFENVLTHEWFSKVERIPSLGEPLPAVWRGPLPAQKEQKDVSEVCVSWCHLVTRCGARTHDHKVKSLALCRLS